jgi:hypothetical protein
MQDANEFKVYWDLWFKISIYLQKNAQLNKSHLDSHASVPSSCEDQSETGRRSYLRKFLDTKEAEIDKIVERHRDKLDINVSLQEYIQIKTS